MSIATAAYPYESDDAVVLAGMQATVDTHREVLQERQLYIPHQYLNYADQSQNPIESCGPRAKARLQAARAAASRKYDSDGVFQKQVPGGFKSVLEPVNSFR